MAIDTSILIPALSIVIASLYMLFVWSTNDLNR